MPFRTSRNSFSFDFGEFLKYAENEFEMGFFCFFSYEFSVPPTWCINYWFDLAETSYGCSLTYSLWVLVEFS